MHTYIIIIIIIVIINNKLFVHNDKHPMQYKQVLPLHSVTYNEEVTGQSFFVVDYTADYKTV